MDVLVLTYFGILLGLGIFIANLMKKWKFPDILPLIFLGFILGPTVYRNPWVSSVMHLTLIDLSVMGIVPDFLRMLALILIVFISTFSMPLRTFKRLSSLTIKLSWGGAILNTILIGISAHFIFGLDWVFSFLLSSILSGTSTGVLYTFEKFMPKRGPINLLKMESIFNAPLSVLLPLMFLGIALTPGLFEPIKYVTQFWLLVVAGIGTGLVMGFGISRALKGMLKEYTPLLLFATALITYAFAEGVGGSGMLAVAVCGLIVGNYSKIKVKEASRFEDQLSELLRISIFTLLGAAVYFSLTPYQLLLALLFFLVIFLLRPVIVLVLLKKEREKFDKRDFLLLSLTAPKGTVESAMAPLVAGALVAAGHPELSGLILNLVFCIIVFSVLTSTILIRILGMKQKSEYKELRELALEEF
ncbi:MAG: hypothetical protein DRP12_01220 [Candidatus Aenigmatarchaeota archaeon]|nr:MAG: hypothetical protein DRP12_01220 [Candidatus Aenigmarchaeota archaeon]